MWRKLYEFAEAQSPCLPNPCVIAEAYAKASVDEFLPGGVVYVPRPTIYAQPKKADCDGCGAPLRLLSRCEYCRRPA